MSERLDELFPDLEAEELPELLDFLIWETNGDNTCVEQWREELLSRPDSASETIQRAVAVCDEYLAPEGSEAALCAARKAWPSEYYSPIETACETHSGSNNVSVGKGT